MKDLQTMVKNFQAPAKQQEPIIVDQFAKQVINKVFKELALIFPAWQYNWKTQQEIDGAKLQWVKAFVENDIGSMEQIRAGFSRARSADTDFLPSCGKFISWCKPSPESMGWPSTDDAMKQCIKHRANQKMFTPLNIAVRPMIVELCKRVDWWPIDHANGAREVKETRRLFDEKYMELLTSGYVEPQVTKAPRIPTKEAVEAGMSEQQKEDRKKRNLERIREIKKMVKRGKSNV